MAQQTAGSQPYAEYAVVDSSEQSLEQFLASVERKGFRMAIIATNNREDALDIVQEAMYKLVQRYADRDASQWGPLFQRILQNTIRDWHRRAQLRNRWRAWLNKDNTTDTVEHDALNSIPDTRCLTPDKQLAHEQSLQQIEQALRQLPLRQQQVFLLRAWEGFDVAQTAYAMGCSTGSVKTHYSRAVQKLRTLLTSLRSPT